MRTDVLICNFRVIISNIMTKNGFWKIEIYNHSLEIFNSSDSVTLLLQEVAILRTY